MKYWVYIMHTLKIYMYNLRLLMLFTSNLDATCFCLKFKTSLLKRYMVWFKCHVV
jgi:hypothetical protein